MAISVVQQANFSGASSGSFTNNVAAGNTVFLYVFSYTTSGATITTSNPTFNGSAVSGAVKLAEKQGTTSSTVYGAMWMLPNLAGGAKSVGITVGGGIVDSNVGSMAIEVSGLGASPAIDSGAAPNPVTATAATANPSAGPTGAITKSPEIILGMSVGFSQPETVPSSPWTGLSNTSGFDTASWQVVTSSGGTFTYTPGATGAAQWIAGVVTVAAGASSAPPPDIPRAQPGPTWLDLFKPGMPKPRPVTPPPASPAVAASGSFSLAPLALSAQAAQTATDLPSVLPGPAWLERFKPQWPRPRPPAPPAGPPAVSASGTLALAPLAFSAQGGQTSPDIPQVQPGPAWLNLFRPRSPRPRPPAPPAGPAAIAASGSLSLAPLAFSASAGQSSPDIPQAQPGPLWQRLFRPQVPKPLPPLPAVQAVSSTGSLALAPLALAGQGSESSPDVPQVSPGPAWLRWFKPGLQRPVPPPPAVQAVSASGSLSLAPLALSASAAQTSPDAPPAPGPTWLRLFRPRAPRPFPPVPAQQAVASSGSLALAPLAFSGSGTPPLQDQIQASPGPSWFRLFKPWAQRPVPPPPAQQPVPPATSSGSLALAPLALSGQAGQSSPDITQAAPGPLWLRLFRPQVRRPLPPVPAIQSVTSSGSLSLAPLVLSAQAGQSAPDQPQAQPGPSWLRFFRPWLRRPFPPVPATPAANAAGSLSLAPVTLSGTGTVSGGGPQDQPQARPGPVWLRLFRPWQARPVPPLPSVPPTVPAGPAPAFTLGIPRFRWDTGSPAFRWATGIPDTPQPEFAAGSPFLRWDTGIPVTQWTTGSPVTSG